MSSQRKTADLRHPANRAPSEDAPLSRIGRYRLVRELAGGGMARVYEAWNDAIGRRVAVKVLRPEYANEPELRQRFFLEARVTNLVQHPGLVVVHEHGVLDNGQAFVVMEYLEGETLSRYLLGPSWRLGDALRLVRQVSAVLRAVHAVGLVHRDLTPANIMVVSDPEVSGGRRAKLVDLGIAKLNPEALRLLTSCPPGPPAAALAEGDDNEDDMPTMPMARPGRLLGTPLYMAPEQIHAPESVDSAADVYALGVILYEIVAGRVPFEGTLTQVLNCHLHTPVPSPRRQNPAAPRALGLLITAMMAKDPLARPNLHTVERILEDLITHEAQPRRARLGWGPLLASCVLVSLGLWAQLAQLPRALGQRTRPVVTQAVEEAPLSQAPRRLPLPIPLPKE